MINRKAIFIFVLSFIASGFGYIKGQSATFSYTGSIQSWTAPGCVSVTITAYGAQGNGDNSTGGLGAEIAGTFTVVSGNVLDIMVGGEGADDPSNGAGGGGGSFIWNTSNSNTLLIAAGGGGGGTVNDAVTFGGGGSATTTPTSGWGVYTAAGGISGNGGDGGSNGVGSYSGAGGGCGWLSNGQNGTAGSLSNPGGGGGYTPLNGGTGGIAAQNWGAVGGFGGGGGGGISGGGGGGYNGGGGGTAYPISPSTCGGGGGGGSYNGGSNQTNVGATNPGNGSVTIAWTVVVTPVTALASVINNVQCGDSNGEATVQTTGVALTYVWTPSGETNDTATGLKAGNYTVTVSSLCGGSASSSVTITQPVNIITDTAEQTQAVSCNGGSNGMATAYGNGGGTPYIYNWTPSGQTTQTATGLSAGTYNVNVYDQCGGSASATVTLTQPNAMVITTTAANISCYMSNDGSASSTVSGGATPYTYSWMPVGGNMATASNLAAQTYTLTVTDNNGCSNSAPLIITQPNLLTVSLNPTAQVACNGGATGSIQSSPIGGTMPYTYAWSGGQTNANASDLIAGSYTLYVVDAHGCSSTATTSLTQPTQLKVVSNSTVDSGSCTGTAWVVVTGGVYNYSYAWSNGNSTYNLHYVCGGKTYCCIVTDGNGCVDTACVNILDVSGVGNVSASSANISIYPNPTNGEFTISVGSAVTGGLKVEVYNLLGEEVYNTQLSGNSGANTEINISNQPGGVYLYRVVSTADGHLAGEGKVVLQK